MQRPLIAPLPTAAYHFDVRQGSMKNDELKSTIAESIANGNRLTDDARTMLDYERPPTAFALAILAQEEYAKALILSLVDFGAVPWTHGVRTVLREHVCKQLVSYILDYLCPDTDEFLKRMDPNQKGEANPIFPPDVLDAIHVICHERIPRERERWWIDSGDRPIDSKVDNVAKAAVDQRKQNALYVGVGRDGRVSSLPGSIAIAEATTEFERAERIGEQIRSTIDPQGLDWQKVVALFALLTGSITPEQFNANWWAR